MSEEKSLREKVFEACDIIAQENKKITREAVRAITGGSPRDLAKHIADWKAENPEERETAITVAENTEISQQSEESLSISGKNIVSPVPIKRSKADIEQIKLEAAERVKAKRLAVVQVAQVFEENPELLPEEIQREIEEAEMAAIATPLSHRAYYDPNALAQAVIASL